VPLVVAAACAHTPQLLVRPPTEDRDLVLRPLDHAFFVPPPDFEFDRELLERLVPLQAVKR